MVKRVLSAVALLLGAAFVAIGFMASRNVGSWALPRAQNTAVPTTAAGSQTTTVVINKGENARSIGNKLQRAGVVRSGTWFSMLAEVDGIQNGLAAGSYVFQMDSDTQAVLDRIKVGILEPQVLVTVQEGLRIEQVADLLEKKGAGQAQALLESMKSGSYSGDLLRDRPANASLEGYIFPDTYYFPKKATTEQIINEMLAALNDRFDAPVRAAAQSSGLNYQQILTLASIVEREAQTPSERPIIAAVFLNRLKQSIPLQADPTVQYAVAADPASVAANGWWKQDLTQNDLKVDSPYNTYKNPGLPPGPICNPGRDAIQAVVQPAQTAYLYFFAKGDGTHAFANTLEEHNANIRKYSKP